MSVEIDKRVVEMQFDNKQFERNVQASLGTIDKLKMALDFDGAKGLDSITKAANKMDLSNISDQTEKIQVSFSALQVAGMTMISELTKSFLNFGKNIWNMSLGQMKTGGMARTLKIEQAEFKLKALAQNILKVKEDSAELTAYVQKMSNAASNAVQGTAYGYDSAMATVSQLVASGINDARTMEDYLKGIAGAAAMTGRSFDDIGSIFSTVASNGKLMTMQLRQFSNAGFNVAAVLADNLGKTEAQIGEMIKKGQISFETFADVISKAYGGAAQKADDTYAGVTSNIKAQLSKVGQLFTDPYVKHMVPFLKNVKAAVKELREALVPTSERFDRFFKRLTEYASILVDQMDFTRLDTIVRGIENLLFGVAGVLYTIYQAFRDVFDRKTVRELEEMAFNFERLTEALLPTEETLAGIRTGFKFLFSILKVGVKMISSLQKALKPLIVYIFRILGYVVALARHLEPFVDSLVKFIKESSILEASMEIISGIIETICNSIVILINILDELFGNFVSISTFKRIGDVLVDISRIINSAILVSLMLVYVAIKKIAALVDPVELEKTINSISSTFGYFINLVIFGVDTIFNFIHTLLNSDTLIGNFLSTINEIIGLFKDIAEGKDLEERLGNLNKVLSDLGESFKKFMEDFRDQMKDITLGKVLLIAFAVGAVMLIFSLQRLTEAMVKFTNTARNTINIGSTINKAFNSFANYSPAAQTLITFAIAVAALTSALVTLSQVEDTEKLITAGKILGAFAAGLLATAVTLTLVYKYFAYTGQGGNVASLAFVMMGIAGALMLLVFAVKAMADLSGNLKDLLKVCASVVGIMGGLAVSVGIMGKLAPKFQISMWSILAFATGTLVLVKALDMLKTFDIQAIWRQVVLLGGLMIAMGVAIGLAARAAKMSNTVTNAKQGITTETSRGSIGGSLLMFAISMKILLGVFQDLCAMPMDRLKSGVDKLRELMLGSFVPLFLSFGVITRLSGGGSGFVADVSRLMMSMALSMIVIFTAITLFATLPEDDLNKAVNAMSGIMAAIGNMIFFIFLLPTIMSGITNIAQMKTGKKISNSTYAIFANLKGIFLALSALILSVGVLSVIAKDMDATAMVNITYILIAIAGLVVATEAFAGFSKGAKAGPILASILMVISIVGTIAFLAAIMSTGELDATSLRSMSVSLGILFASIGALLAGLGYILKATHKETPEAKMGTLPIVTMVLAFLAASVAIIKFSKDADFNTVIAVFVGMAALIVAMIFLIDSIKRIREKDYSQLYRLSESMKVIYPALAIFGAMIAGFAALALVINHVSDGAWGKALITMGLISLFIIGMGYMLDKAAENAGVLDDVGGTLKTLWSAVGMISVLSLVIAAITAIPAKQGTIAKLVALGAIVAALIIFLDRLDFDTANEGTFKHMKTFAKSFAIMCAGVVAIAAAIALVANADFSEGSNIGLKIAALGAAVILMIALFIYMTQESKSVKWKQLLAMGGTIVAMSSSLLIIAEAINKMASIPSTQMESATRSMSNLLIAFGILAGLAGAISGIHGFGKGFDLGLLAISVAMLSFGASLLMIAESVKIFAEAVHDLADMSTEDVDKVVNNINRFLEQIPVMKEKLKQFGPDLAETIALWIQYIVYGFAMATGSLISAGFTAVIAFLAGFLMALPAILDAVGVVIDVVADWIIENKDIISNAFQATFEAILAAGKGMIDAFFDYYGISLEEFLKASEDKINAKENNEAVKRGSDQTRINSLEKWYEDEKKLIDAGASEFKTYQEAQSKLFDMAEAMYRDELLTKEEFKQIVENVTEMSNIDWDEYFENGKGAYLDYARQMRQEVREENTSDLAHQIVSDFMFMTGQGRPNYDAIHANDVNRWLTTNQDDYFPYLTRTDSDVKLQLQRAGEYGKNLGDEILDGFNGAIDDSEKDVRTRANNYTDQVITQNMAGWRRTGGSSTATNAANNMVRLAPANGINGLSGGVNIKKLKDDLEPKAEDLGEAVKDASVDGATSNYSNEIMKKIDAGLGKLNAYALGMGIDIGTTAKGGFLSTLTDYIPTGSSLFDGIKTTDQIKAEYSEMVPIVKEINGMSVNVGTQSRWRAKGYESLEAAIRANSKYGESWLDRITGWGKDAIEEAKDMANEFIPSVDSLSDGLDELGDSAGYATDYTDKLKESIENSLDVFSEFNKEVKLTSREVLASFYSQIDGVHTWQKELEDLASRGMNKNFLKQLAEEGPNSYDKIHAFYTMTEAEMELFNTMYAQKLMIQRSSQNQIRKTFVATGNMMQDELEKFETSIEEQYDEKVSRAQAKAAKTKAGTIAESTQKSLDNMYQTIEEYEDDTKFIDQWKDYIGSSTVKLDLANAFTQLGYSSIDAFAQSMNFQKVMEKILQFKNTVKEQVKSSLNLFDEVKEVKEKDKMTTTEILNNMEENLKRVGGWSYNLRKMIKMGFSEGLVEELRKMGPESADKVEAFVKMTGEEMSMANKYWAESVKLPESISNSLTDEYSKAGFEISLGLKKGLDEGSEDFYDYFKTAGEDASQGYVDGINADAANDTMEQLGKNTLNKLMEVLDEHSPSREMMKIGYNAVAGYLIGLKNGIKGLMPFTKELGDGVVNGFTENVTLDQSMSTATNSIDDILNTMTDKIYNIGAAFNMNSVDNVYQPVIRPVWDTTAIETGFTTIDQFLTGKTISLKAVDAATQRTVPSQDAIMITNAINGLLNEQRAIRNEVNDLGNDISNLGNRIDGMYVRLDGNALVGQIVSPMDKAMGKKVVTQKRGRV